MISSLVYAIYQMGLGRVFLLWLSGGSWTRHIRKRGSGLEAIITNAQMNLGWNGQDSSFSLIKLGKSIESIWVNEADV